MKKIAPMIPKNEKHLENDYNDCLKRKRFIEAEKDTYKEYIERAEDDFLSAKRDFDSKDFYWCIIKAYQSIFFACNAILIKEYGFFSKDHKCLISALLKFGIDKKISEKIKKIFTLAENLEKVDIIRQKRNIALYHPKAKIIISSDSVNKVLEDSRTILNFIIEVLE